MSEPTSLTLDDAPLAVDAALRFSQLVILAEGLNAYTFTVTDVAGHTTTATARVTLDTVPPAVPDQTQIHVTDPEAGMVSVPGRDRQRRTERNPGYLAQFASLRGGFLFADSLRQSVLLTMVSMTDA